MKENVDLTENRLFSNDWLGDILTFNLITVNKFPWNASIKEIRTNDDLDLDHQKNAIITVGNKKTRAKVKFYREMDSSDYCDCCGKRMNTKPWNKEIGTCHNCDNIFFKDEDKCIWRKNTN